MSQTDLATATGLALRTIGHYEQGRVPKTEGVPPDGYYDVARALGWTPDSVDSVLTGGEPTRASPPVRVETDVERLIGPAWEIADQARDLGAPADLVERYRTASIALLGWLSHRAPGENRALGEGVAPEDREAILRAIEGDK